MSFHFTLPRPRRVSHAKVRGVAFGSHPPPLWVLMSASRIEHYFRKVFGSNLVQQRRPLNFTKSDGLLC